MIVTSAAANTTPPTRKAPARYQPGARSWAVIDVPPSLRHLGKVLHQRVELSRLERVAEVRRHDPVREALRHVGRRVDDRLLDERLVLALEALVQVGARAARRAGVAELVAAAAAGVREDRLAVGRCAAAATTAGLPAARGAGGPLLQPLVELGLVDDVRGLAHDGVAEAAQLRADDRVLAVPLRRDPQVRVDARHGVDL